MPYQQSAPLLPPTPPRRAHRSPWPPFHPNCCNFTPSHCTQTVTISHRCIALNIHSARLPPPRLSSRIAQSTRRSTAVQNCNTLHMSKGVVIHASFRGEQDDRFGVGVWDLGVGVWGLGFGMYCFGFSVLGLGFICCDLWFDILHLVNTLWIAPRNVCTCFKFCNNVNCSVFVWMRSFESQEQRDAQ